MKKIKKYFIRLVGNKNKKKYSKKDIKTILIPGGRIGDVIVKTPMIRELKKEFPNSEITVSVTGGANKIIENNPNVDKILLVKDKAKKSRISKIVNGLLESYKKNKKYDLIFDVGNSINFFHILGLRLVSPKILIGSKRVEKYGIKSTELNIFDYYIEKKDHARDITLEMLKPLGIKTEKKEYEIFIPKKIEEKYKTLFDENKKSIIFNYRGSSIRKSLTEKEILYFLKELENINQNIEVFVLTMPLDYNKIKQTILKMNLKKIKIAPKTNSILEAAELIKKSDYVLTVDTSIVHIASTFNKPMVAIYPNNPGTLKLYAPIGQNVEIITAPNYTGNNIEGFDKKEVILKLKKLLQD